MNLYEIRQKYDLPQTLIADLAGTTRQTISQIDLEVREGGAKDVKLSTAVKISAAIYKLTKKSFSLEEIFGLQ